MPIAVATADGQLPNAKGTLYTVPALTKAYIKSISLNNTGGATETIQLYVKPGATSRKLPTVILDTLESAVFDAFALAAGDLIEGETTNATAVDYVISVVEET